MQCLRGLGRGKRRKARLLCTSVHEFVCVVEDLMYPRTQQTANDYVGGAVHWRLLYTFPKNALTCGTLLNHNQMERICNKYNDRSGFSRDSLNLLGEKLEISCRCKNQENIMEMSILAYAYGCLSNACLSVPLPYNRVVRIMVWFKGRHVRGPASTEKMRTREQERK